MMKTALLAALVAGLVATASLAAAQPDPQQVANETVQKGKSVVDDVVDGASGVAPKVDAGAGKGGAGLGGAASAFGHFLQAVADSAAAAAASTGKALAGVGTFLASGLSGGLVAAVQGLGAGLGGLGAVLAATLALLGAGLVGAGGWIGAQLGALLAIYAKFVGTLRPKAMDPAAFTAVAGTGAAATTAAAGYGLWALAKKYAWLLSGAAGFSRIEDSALLEHPLRAQVFQVIQQNPGVHASELSRKVGAGWGTIVHHLDKLEKGRLVTARRVNNQKCFFEDGGKVSRQDMAIAGAVRGDSASLITAYVTAHPMTSQKSMASELGISPALTSFHVKKLSALGVLDKVRRGKETLLTTTQAVRRVLTPSAIGPIAPMVGAQG
ncbi:MAG: winged helix-turn-helix transcriptional regulator [Thermoplasmatota archaeon]|nr:hypothetical protein [Halobacteriales archaeon]